MQSHMGSQTSPLDLTLGDLEWSKAKVTQISKPTANYNTGSTHVVGMALNVKASQSH